MHQTATLAEWHKTKGRHEIFAKGKRVDLKTTSHSLVLPVLNNSGSGCCSSSNPGLLDKDREILSTIRSER
jgi:hypothetical protein